MNKKYIIYIVAIAVITYFVYSYVNKKPEVVEPNTTPESPVNNTIYETWQTNKLYTPNTIVWWNNLLYTPFFLIGQSQNNDSPDKDGRWKLVDANGIPIVTNPVVNSNTTTGNLTDNAMSNVNWDSLLNNANSASTNPTITVNNTTYPTWVNKEYTQGQTVWFNGISYRALMLIGGNNNNTPDKDGRWQKI